MVKLSFPLIGSLCLCLQLSNVFARAIDEPASYSKRDVNPIKERQSVPAIARNAADFQWFFQNLRERGAVYRDRTLLFYSRRNGRFNPTRAGLSLPAQSAAATRSWSTIWDGWPGSPTAGEDANGDRSFYGINNENGMLRGFRYQFTQNPPEQVPDNSPQTGYFRRMSAVYAMQARGDVVVMTEDPRNVRMDGIWGETEYRILRGEQYTDPPTGQNFMNSRITRIYATNEHLTDWYIIWDRNDSSITPENPTHLPREPYINNAGGAEPANPEDGGARPERPTGPEKRQGQGMPVENPELLEADTGRYYMDFFG